MPLPLPLALPPRPTWRSTSRSSRTSSSDDDEQRQWQRRRGTPPRALPCGRRAPRSLSFARERRPPSRCGTLREGVNHGGPAPARLRAGEPWRVHGAPNPLSPPPRRRGWARLETAVVGCPVAPRASRPSPPPPSPLGAGGRYGRPLVRRVSCRRGWDRMHFPTRGGSETGLLLSCTWSSVGLSAALRRCTLTLTLTLPLPPHLISGPHSRRGSGNACDPTRDDRGPQGRPPIRSIEADQLCHASEI